MSRTGSHFPSAGCGRIVSKPVAFDFFAVSPSYSALEVKRVSVVIVFFMPIEVVFGDHVSHVRGGYRHAQTGREVIFVEPLEEVDDPLAYYVV